ncbi:MAG TPA: hypothetical protein VMM55_10640 [Thermohalobaculum sp.]|nr:hypothetical protein [Thermohalobaculum sp.]
MTGLLRASLLGLAILAGGCGMFDDDEERLEGERIPVRAAVSGYGAQPAPAVPAVAETETEQN